MHQHISCYIFVLMPLGLTVSCTRRGMLVNARVTTMGYDLRYCAGRIDCVFTPPGKRSGLQFCRFFLETLDCRRLSVPLTKGAVEATNEVYRLSAA